ncbi:hypothetical protein ACSBR2_017779 [Camellia fascicularis]
MNRELKRGKQERDLVVNEKVVIVAVKASKEIPKTALIWALTHVVQPGDCITLLVVLPSQSSSTFLCPVGNYGISLDLQETVPVATEGLIQEQV